VRRFIHKRVPDPHVASDLAQDVMLKIYRSLKAAPEDERLASWVLKIARNTVIDYYRSRPPGASSDRIDNVVDDADEPDNTKALAACLRPMAERLPARYRQAVLLSEFEGLTQQAVAERAGITLSGAKSRVQRGREMLKAMLLECCRVQVGAAGGVVDYERTERSQDYCGDSCP
jgi:RNA polymerase sigma-70 factor (ECF subfamily)